jgi:hypothetical protein
VQILSCRARSCRTKAPMLLADCAAACMRRPARCMHKIQNVRNHPLDQPVHATPARSLHRELLGGPRIWRGARQRQAAGGRATVTARTAGTFEAGQIVGLVMLVVGVPLGKQREREEKRMAKPSV